VRLGKKKKYDPKITLKKGIQVFLYGGIGYLISYLSGLPQTETIVVTITILTILKNYLKHRI